MAGRLGLQATSLLLLGLVCLALVGPLRGVLTPFPALLFLASFALFMIPGALLSGLIRDDGLSGAARITVAFVFSTGIFGLSGIPLLVLHRSIGEYLVLCGIILATSLLVLALGALVGHKGATGKDGDPPETPRSFKDLLSVYWPWVPFLVLAGALAYASMMKAHGTEEDIWAYLANVREFLNADSLASYNPYFGGEFSGFSRMMINGWLLEQAALARVSGIDPVEMAFGYLTPALMLLSLLSVYALAKTVIGNETGAVLTGCLFSVLVLVCLTTPLPQSLLTGGEFIGRVTEDKYVVRLVFVPVALALAVLALKKRRVRYLLLFAFVCPSAAAVHPLGLVFIGLPVAGLGLLHLLFNLRDRGAWLYVGALGLSLLAVGGPPTAYLVAVDHQLIRSLESMAPTVASSLVSGFDYYDQIQQVGDRYIVDPALLLNPAVLAAYVLGAPFLLLRVRRSPAAQLLLGTLLLVPLLCFVPPIAGPVAEVIGPWILPRLAWPIPLAAVVVLGWILWEVLVYLGARLGESGFWTARTSTLLLALTLLTAGLLAAAPFAVAQIESVDESGEIPQEEVSCSDPVFGWMEGGLPSRSTVLAPEAENSCIMARTSSADILNYRKQKPGKREYKTLLERFFDSPTLDSGAIRVLQYYGVDYVMLPTDNQLNEQMKYRSESFTPVEIPGDRYALYEVVDPSNLESDALNSANDRLVAGDFEAAADAYEQPLGEAQRTGEKDTLSLSYLGLGQSFMGQKLPAEAASYFERLAELNPGDEVAYLFLAKAWNEAGEENEARAALEQAVELAPHNVELRRRLADLLLKTGDEAAAVKQHQTLVRTFPEVPKYRVDLGRTLLLAGDEGAAQEQFEEATELNPLSDEVHASVGDALRNAGRLRGAAARYERAVELRPKNQLHHLELGKIYSALSTADGWDEEYFDKAEETLVRAARLEPVPGSRASSKEAALLALGDLYYRWDRQEEAITTYEQVLDVDPDSQEARSRLEELQR